MSEREVMSEFSSWKEIAAHLQVSVRTAQSWEKERGLPVRRIPGKRGRVYLRLDELEEWLESQEGQRPGAGDPSRSTWPSALSGRRAVAVLVVAVLVLSAVAYAVSHVARHGAPAGVRVERNLVVGVHASGSVVWEYELPDGYEPSPLLEPKLVDLDDDGVLETLVPLRGDPLVSTDRLVALSARGETLWTFDAGRPMATEGLEFDGLYGLQAMTLVRVDGEQVVATAATHHLEFPTQIATLDPRTGVPIDEYWHPGHIGAGNSRFAAFDADGDGVQEIYATGISNARERATLVVLDPREMAGAAAVELPRYRFLGVEPAREIARVFFVRSELGFLDPGQRFNVGGAIRPTASAINVDVNETLRPPLAPVLYRFSHELELEQVSLSDGFHALYGRALAEGHFTLPIEEVRARLAEVEIERRAMSASTSGTR